MKTNYLTYRGVTMPLDQYKNAAKAKAGQRATAPLQHVQYRGAEKDLRAA